MYEILEEEVGSRKSGKNIFFEKAFFDFFLGDLGKG
jgi:hypothetical protein